MPKTHLEDVLHDACVYIRCAEGMKRTSFELGGNAPFIVFEDGEI